MSSTSRGSETTNPTFADFGDLKVFCAARVKNSKELTGWRRCPGSVRLTQLCFLKAPSAFELLDLRPVVGRLRISVIVITQIGRS